MVSAVSTSKLASTQKITGIIATGGTSVVTAYHSLALFETIGFLATVAALTGAGITKLEIVVATNASGAGLAVAKDSGALLANAVGDQAFLEATVDEIAQLGSVAGVLYSHSALRLTIANAADVVAVTRILASPSYAVDLLTPASVIS